jgi:hypothetical protein
MALGMSLETSDSRVDQSRRNCIREFAAGSRKSYYYSPEKDAVLLEFKFPTTS